MASRREAFVDRDAERQAAENDRHWIRVCNIGELKDGRGRIVPLPNELVAVFLYDGKLSAVSNVCAHQNGPLGEGRVIDGLVTCPWHGFQYRPEDGCAPSPYTERIATYRLALEDGAVMLDPTPNAPGTYIEPLRIIEATR